MVIVSFLFFVFGLVQIASITEKMRLIASYLKTQSRGKFPLAIPVPILFKYDCIHATLSLVAKTLLAWLLLGPALSVKLDLLKDRIYE
jgi:hypothetical protein